MDDLVTFLRARLDEDERIAKAAVRLGDMKWATDEVGSLIFYGAEEDQMYYSVEWEERAAHIARHDPARVLREVDAKRQIIDLCDRRLPGGGVRWLDVASARDVQIVRALALPYVDHADYLDEWRP